MADNSSQQELQIFADRVLGKVSTTRKIGDVLGSSTDSTTEVRRRWGVVTAIDIAGGTVDVRLDGMIVPNMRRMSWYQPLVGETVMIEYAGNDPVCIGPIGISQGNLFAAKNHTHSLGSLSPKVRTVVMLNQTVDTQILGVPVDAVDVDNFIIEGSGSTYELDKLTLYAPGLASYIPADQKRQQYRIRSRTNNLQVTLQQGGNIRDWSFASSGMNTNVFTIPADGLAFVDTVYSELTRRFHVLSISNSHYVPQVTRPGVRWNGGYAFVGIGGYIDTPTDTPVGAQLVVFHTNDYGYWGEMQTPSGTAGTWTFLKGGGSDFNNHVNAWTRTVTVAGAQRIQVNQAYSFASTVMAFVITQAAPVQPNDVSFLNYANAQTSLGTQGFTVPAYDCLYLQCWGFTDPVTFGGYGGGLSGTKPSGGSTVAVPGLVGPLTRTCVDGNSNPAYHSAVTVTRYADTPTTMPPSQITVSPAQTASWVGVFVRPPTS